MKALKMMKHNIDKLKTLQRMLIWYSRRSVPPPLLADWWLLTRGFPKI